MFFKLPNPKIPPQAFFSLLLLKHLTPLTTLFWETALWLLGNHLGLFLFLTTGNFLFTPFADSCFGEMVFPRFCPQPTRSPHMLPVYSGLLSRLQMPPMGPVCVYSPNLSWASGPRVQVQEGQLNLVSRSLAFQGHVILGKSFNFSVPHFPQL